MQQSPSVGISDGSSVHFNQQRVLRIFSVIRALADRLEKYPPAFLPPRPSSAAIIAMIESPVS